MTTLLKALGKEARDYAYATEVDMHGDPTWFDLYEKKLAELLIKHCASVADANYDKGFCPVGTFIKEAFNVKS